MVQKLKDYEHYTNKCGNSHEMEKLLKRPKPTKLTQEEIVWSVRIIEKIKSVATNFPTKKTPTI